METAKLVGTLLGGLGLFLLAIGMMTDGLKLAAGKSLRKLLSEWSRTPLRGIFAGSFMTAIVQSSSAVTVASLGFVNAGLISMRQSLGIIYGANIGTTMTGWLVALVGFNLNINTLALPMIGCGMLMKLGKRHGKIAYFGLALAGFGLFFLGIDVLKNAFEGLVQAFDISKLTADGISGILTFLLLGIAMTILTQSSSASIALTITAASTGVVGMYAAGAMVIGANIGTTSTAIIATIGATSNAKRVAAAQVIFNAVTALVALIILPIIFYFIDFITSSFGVTSDLAISLALFHSVFNILGVLLVYPHNARLATFLDARFHTWEEKASHPQYLDKTIAQTPVLAINALVLENLAISEKIKTLYSKSIPPNPPDAFGFESDAKVLRILSSEVFKFIVSIEASALDEGTTEDLAALMRIDQYFLSCTQSLEHIAYQLESREKFSALVLEEDFTRFFERVLSFMEDSYTNEPQALDLFGRRFSELNSEHDRVKANLILEGTRSHISVVQMSESIDCLAETLRLAQQWFKAFTWLHILQEKLDISENSTQ